MTTPLQALRDKRDQLVASLTRDAKAAHEKRLAEAKA